MTKKTESKAEKTESKVETKTVTKKAVKVVDPNQPYYFPAPEISEEKKLSLMSKYLDLDDEKPKKRTVNPGGGKKNGKGHFQNWWQWHLEQIDRKYKFILIAP